MGGVVNIIIGGPYCQIQRWESASQRVWLTLSYTFACGGGGGERSTHSCLEIDTFCPTQIILSLHVSPMDCSGLENNY